MQLIKIVWTHMVNWGRMDQKSCLGLNTLSSGLTYGGIISSG